MEKISSKRSENWQQNQIAAILYYNAAGAIAGTAASIFIASFILLRIYPTMGLLYWFIAGQTVSLIRFYFYRRYKQDIKQYKITTWLNIIRFLSFLSGSLYGVLAVLFFSSDQPLYQILVILLTAGITTAAVATLGTDKITYRVFMCAAMIPLIARCLWEGTEVHYAISALILLQVFVLIISANKSREIILENIHMSHSLRYRATHDVMVDLLNRHEFQNEFITTMATSSGDDSVVSIIFIDLDNFKALNDTYGHQVGDKALIDIAQIIRHSIRKSDIAARFGGDEFMILIQSQTEADAQTVAENILQRINQYKTTIETDSIVIGASMGIGYTQNKGIEFETLLSTADSACYEAKNQGKGNICRKKVDQNPEQKKSKNPLSLRLK